MKFEQRRESRPPKFRQLFAFTTENNRNGTKHSLVDGTHFVFSVNCLCSCIVVCMSCVSLLPVGVRTIIIRRSCDAIDIKHYGFPFRFCGYLEERRQNFSTCNRNKTAKTEYLIALSSAYRAGCNFSQLPTIPTICKPV